MLAMVVVMLLMSAGVVGVEIEQLAAAADDTTLTIYIVGCRVRVLLEVSIVVGSVRLLCGIG